MILAISGEDTYRSKQRLRVLIDAFKKKHDPSGLNISRFSGANVSFDNVQASFGTMSFLAKKRLVVFEDFFGTKQSETQKRIIEYLLKRDSDNTILLFYQSGNFPGQSGRTAIIKKAKQETFELLEGLSLTKFIQKEAQSRTLQLSQSAVTLLESRVGSDLWTLSSVLDQLSAFAKDRMVTDKDVIEFTQSVIDDNIFHLTDAIAARNERKALELVIDQLESGNHPLYLLTMVVKQFRLLLELSSPGSHSPESTGVHPFVFGKAQSTAHRFSREVLQNAYKNLEEMDQDLKRGNKDALTLFARFIHETAVL